MTCLIRLLLNVNIIYAIVNFPAARCARNSLSTLKEGLASTHINLSNDCFQDFSLYIEQLQEGATWALNMFDSSGKPESGVLNGGHTLLGFYSECINALLNNEAIPERGNRTIAPTFSSIYCLSTIRTTPDQKIPHKGYLQPLCENIEGVDLTLAVCAPSTCNTDDVGKVAELSWREWGCTANVTSTVCRQPMEPFLKDWPAIAVTFFLGMLAALVIVATLFDWKRRKTTANCEKVLHQVGPKNNEDSIRGIGPSEHEPMNCMKNALLCFSLFSNGKKLFLSDSPNSDSIRVLHGLRFFSMAWVICMHTWTTSDEMATFRDLDMSDSSLINFTTGFALRGQLAIDTFFFMGGLVLSYSTLKQLRKNGGKKSWLLFYAHRYLRTVPMVMIVVAIYAFLMRHFGDGPRWAYYVSKHETNCRISWWTYLLYVQNFVFLNHQCLGHTWYSAADFQIYLISPPILYALYKNPHVGTAIAGVLCVVSTVSSVTYSSLMEMRFTDKRFDYMLDVGYKPYFRLSPYLLGTVMGLFLSNRSKTMSPPQKRYAMLGWLSCAFCLLFSIYGIYINDPPTQNPWYGTFTAISSSLWAVGLAWIVYASVAHCGGIFARVLTSKPLETLSKLTFSTYIIHYPVVNILFANLEGSLYYSSFLESYFFAGNLLLSYCVSVIFCLFIELPMLGIQKLLLAR